MSQTLEELIVFHCSPTLAMLKPASMFSIPVSLGIDRKQIDKQNQLLNHKEIFIEVLVKRKTYWLIFVYHRKMLWEHLKNQDHRKFLEGYGYQYLHIRQALLVLKKHMAYEDFPHEVGIFLGYPLADVKAFIEYGGKNFTSMGYWKVYHNPKEANLLFERFSNCVEQFIQMFHEGTRIENLIRV